MSFLLALFLAGVLPAQVNEERRTAHPRVFALTELARSAAPEFAADGLLQLLDANAIPTRDWQIDIAQEALQFAASARQESRRRLVPGIQAPDSGAMLRQAAYSRGLDRLSLSLRAIDHLRRADPDAARKAFSALTRPATLSPPACKEPFTDDLGAWYKTAGRLRADPLPMVQSVQSHAEIAPSLDFIFQRTNTPEELELLAGALGERLRALPASPRGFAAALFDAPKRLRHLREALVAQERSTAGLDAGWRAWMQSGMEAPACQESRTGGPQEEARFEAFDAFHAVFGDALAPELRKPADLTVAADLEPFAETDEIRTQAALFRTLLFGTDPRGVPTAGKNTPEWREQMDKFVQSIEGRTRSASERDIEFFYRQSQLWTAVLMASPAGPNRDRALQRAIGFLLANAPHMEPAIWFAQVVSMAESSRSLHGEEFAKVLDSFRLTGHPVLRLYAELQSAYPSRPHPSED